MTASHKTAAAWPLLTFALWVGCLLQLRCEPAAPPPIDAGAPAVLDMNAPQLLDLMPVAPACVPCSWTAPYMGCDPSLCALQGSRLCCRPRSGGWRRRMRIRSRRRRARMRSRFARAGHDGFAPASLVGMSESAKKRGVRWEVAENLKASDSDKRKADFVETFRKWYRVGQRVRLCGCWYWGDRDCELCGSQRIVPVNTPEQRRQHRRRERSRIAWNHSGCAHDIDEWLDAGRECPSKDEHGVCNEIPF